MIETCTAAAFISNRLVAFLSKGGTWMEKEILSEESRGETEKIQSENKMCVFVSCFVHGADLLRVQGQFAAVFE